MLVWQFFLQDCAVPDNAAYLVMSAARRPADVITSVCGLPVFFEAEDRLLLPSGCEP